MAVNGDMALNKMVTIPDRHMNFHVNHIGALNRHPLLTTKNRPPLCAHQFYSEKEPWRKHR